jgi:hypothetical protein
MLLFPSLYQNKGNENKIRGNFIISFDKKIARQSDHVTLLGLLALLYIPLGTTVS